jgi:hypothetical protein
MAVVKIDNAHVCPGQMPYTGSLAAWTHNPPAVGTLRRHAAQLRPEEDFSPSPCRNITLAFQGMQLEGTPGQRLGVYVAEPGTPDYDAIVPLDMTALTHAGQPVVQKQP